MSFVHVKKNIENQKSEAQYKELKQFNISDTIKTPIRLVKVAGVPVGIAYNDEDEKRLLETLHHYGQNLLTAEDVYAAIQKMLSSVCIAEDLREAGFTPENEVTVNGKTVFTIDGNLYDTNGEKLND